MSETMFPVRCLLLTALNWLTAQSGSLAETGRGMPLCLLQGSIMLQVNKYTQSRWCAVRDMGSNCSGVWKYFTWSAQPGWLPDGQIDLTLAPAQWESFIAHSVFASQFSPHLFCAHLLAMCDAVTQQPWKYRAAGVRRSPKCVPLCSCHGSYSDTAYILFTHDKKMPSSVNEYEDTIKTYIHFIYFSDSCFQIVLIHAVTTV